MKAVHIVAFFLNMTFPLKIATTLSTKTLEGLKQMT